MNADGDYNSAEHPGEAKGYQESSYDLSKYESINLANGNLTFRVPLYTLSTAGGLSYQLSLTHNHKQQNTFPTCAYSDPLNPDDCIKQGPVSVPGGMRVYGYSWDLRPPRIVIQRAVPNGVYPSRSPFLGEPHWIDESGASHNLVGQPPWNHNGVAHPCHLSEEEPACYTTTNKRVTAQFDAAGERTGFTVEDPSGTVYRLNHHVELPGSPSTFEDYYFLLDIPGWYATAIERGPRETGSPKNTVIFGYCGGDVINTCPSEWSEPWLLREITASGEGDSSRTVVLNYENSSLCEEAPSETCHTSLDSISIPSFNPSIQVDETDSEYYSSIDLEYDSDLLTIVVGTNEVFTPRLKSIKFVEDQSTNTGPAFRFILGLSMFDLTLDGVELPSGATVRYEFMLHAYPQGTINPSHHEGVIIKPTWFDPMKCNLHDPSESPPERSSTGPVGMIGRTITYLDSSTAPTGPRSETTKFNMFKNCAQSDDDVAGRLDWPYDFSRALRVTGAANPQDEFIRYYLWTVVQTFDSTDPNAENPVFQTEIHRFNPVTYEEFSADLLELTTIDIVDLAAEMTIYRGVEDFARWGSPVRLRHTMTEKMELFDLGDLFPGKDRADPSYEYVAENRVLWFVDSNGNPSPSCYPTVSDPDYPPAHTCLVVKETIGEGDVDSYLNVLKKHTATENAPVAAAIDRIHQSTFDSADLTNWRGFDRVESTTVCEGTNGADCSCLTDECTFNGFVWEPVSDGVGGVDYYRLLREFSNPTGTTASAFVCGSETDGGCTENEYGYDDYGNQTSVSVRGGFNTTFTAEEALTTHTDFKHGKPAKKWLEHPTGGSLLIWEREIDPNTGLPRWHVSGSGAGAAYLFDELGRITEIAPVQGTYSDQTGWSLAIQETTDDQGNAYNLSGSKIYYSLPGEELPDQPATTDLLTHSVFDSTDQDISSSLTGTTTGPLRSRYVFDGRGRQTGWIESYIDEDGNMATRSRASQDLIGSTGRIQKTSEWSSGSDLSSTANWTTTTLDGLGRPIGIEAPDGSIFTTSYLGATQSTTTRSVKCSTIEECDFTTTSIKDGLGRVVKVIEDVRTVDDEMQSVSSTYVYDPNDRLLEVKVVDADGTSSQTRTFDYSAAGFLIGSTEPERVMTYNTYDALGNVLEDSITESATSMDRCYVYDDFGRMEWKLVGPCVPGVQLNDSTPKYSKFEYGDSKASEPATIGTTGYNKLSSATQDNRYLTGEVTNIVSVEHRWAYDGPGGRVSGRSTLIEGFGNAEDSFDIGYMYDQWGNTCTVKHPVWSADTGLCSTDVRSHHSFIGSWLMLSDLTAEDHGTSDVGTTMSYHPSGRVARVDYVDDGLAVGFVSEEVDPDGMARPAAINWGWEPNGGGTPVVFKTEGTYVYDGSGNIASVGTGPDAKYYAYDGVNRLREFWRRGVMSETFEYDAWGNLTTWNRYGTEYFSLSFPEIDLALTNRPGEVVIGPDPETTYALGWEHGNLKTVPGISSIGVPARSYAFSDEDRLMQSTVLGGSSDYRYAYDTNGERIASWRRDGGIVQDVELTIRDEAGAVLTEWLWTNSPNFTRTKDYFYSGGRLVAQLNWAGGSPATEYVFPDHLGSTRVMRSVDGDSKFVEYFPFGAFVEGEGSLLNTDHLFTGHERDLGALSSGLDYMHARYYSPNLGRFLSVDPVGGTVGSSQSWNRYSYVQNSPLGFIDPDGKYGRGTFFTDKQWKAFDKAQKNAAKKMEKRADKLEKKADKLEAKGKSGADERRVEANYLREGAAVLNDDGSNGYYAHAMNSTEYGQYGSENGVAGVFENCDMDIFVNIDHSEFSSGGLGLQRVVAHESMHNIGLSDEPVGADVHGYMRGTPEARNVYRALIGTYMELINPDHLVSFMDPRGP